MFYDSPLKLWQANCIYLIKQKTKIMKLRIIASALLIIVLSAGISTNAGAHPWRGGGWCMPHPVVRVWAPPIPIIAPPVVVGGYYGGGYYRHPYYGHRYAYGYGHGYRGGYGRGCYRGRR